MEVPKRAAIREILLAIKTILTGVVYENRIFIVARSTARLPNMQAPNDIVLRPRGFSVNQDRVAAAGRYVTQLTRVIDVIVRTRRELDKVGEDVQWLTDEFFGYFDIEEAILSALQVQIDGPGDMLFDANGNSLLVEPMRIVDGTTPEKDITGKTPGWGVGSMGIEVKYLANLDTTIQ